jgi:hypothetical protein
MSSNAANLIERNKLILKSLIKNIEFCGRQGIALRGHREEVDCNSTTVNKGNFQALIQLRIDSGDTALKEHLNTCPRNATYISKTN